MAFENGGKISFGEFSFDLDERILTRGSEHTALAPKAAETLALLIENHGRLMTKDELMERLWPDTAVEERNLAQNIFTIRKALGEKSGEGRYIETVPRRGYRFVAEARREAGSSEHGGEAAPPAFVPASDTARMPPARTSRSLYGAAGLVLAAAAAAVAYLLLSGGNVPGHAGSAASAPSLKRLTDSGKAWFPAVSADGRRIAYVFHSANHDSIRIQDMATGSVSEIVPPSRSDIGQPEFSPDGSRVIYPARDGGTEATVYSVPVLGGKSEPIAFRARSEASVSPDGGHLAFIRFNGETDELEVVLSATNGRGERVLTKRKGEKQYRVWESSPGWSPDGRKIVTAAFDQGSNGNGPRRNYLVEIDVRSGAETEIPGPEFFVFGQAIWAGDGKAVYAIAQESAGSSFQVWSIDRATGKPARITNDLLNYERLSLTADGKGLVTGVRSGFYNIWIHDTEGTSDAVQLTNSIAVRNGFYGIAWTPDGRDVIYSQTDDLGTGNLWTVNVETGVERQLTFDEIASNLWPCITPDGRSVIYASNRSGKWHLWRLDPRDGVITQFTNGAGESHPQLSPDGRLLIYGSPGDVPKETWLMEMPEGEPRKILEDSGGPAHFSPDSSGIAINYFDRNEKRISPWKFGIMPSDGSSPPSELPINSERSILRWRPDGEAIYFIEPGRSQNNVRLFHLGSRRTTPVTSFPEMKIVNLGVSPDGRYLAMARGVAASDIVRITIQ